MLPGPIALLIGLLLTAPVGCGPRSPKPPPDELTLYAIQSVKEPQEKFPDAEFLHGYRILGQSEIEEPERRGELMFELLASELKSTSSGQPMCYYPRHGLRATTEGVVKDYVICFQCSTVYVHSQGKVSKFYITGAAKPLFNRSLQEEGLPVPAEPQPTPRPQPARSGAR